MEVWNKYPSIGIWDGEWMQVTCTLAFKHYCILVYCYKRSFKRRVMFSENFFIKQSYHDCHTRFAVFFSPSCCLLSWLYWCFFLLNNKSLLTTLSSFLVLFTVSWTVLCTNTVTCYFFVSWKRVKCSTCRLLIISLISIYLRLIISSLFYYPHKR